MLIIINDSRHCHAPRGVQRASVRIAGFASCRFRLFWQEVNPVIAGVPVIPHGCPPADLGGCG